MARVRGVPRINLRLPGIRWSLNGGGRVSAEAPTVGPKQEFDREAAGESDQHSYRQVFLPKHGEIKKIPERRHGQHERKGGVHETNDHHPPAVQRPR
jgi:hypothetical protein